MWLKKINIYIIICLAFVIRLISLNQSLWWDEAINVVYARQNDFWWYMTKYTLGDFHPPGWFFILWIWGHLFGWTEIAVRMPSVFLGVGTVYLTFLIGKELFSKKAGLLAALMLSLAPLHIYYSQEARMYSFSAFAVSLSIYSLILLINRRKYSWLVFIFSAALVLYSDYVAYFIFPVQFIYLLFFERRAIKIYFFSFICSLIIFIPWILVFPEQLTNGQKIASSISGWKDVVGGNSFKELILLPIKVLVGRISFDNNILYFSFIAIVAAPFLFILFNIKKVFDKKYCLILMWLIISPILVWLFSYFLPIFSYFRLLFVVPALYIAIAVCIDKLSYKRQLIFMAIILIFELCTSCLYLFNSNFQREDWRNAIQFIDQKINSKSLVIFKSNEIASPFIYYTNQPYSIFPAFKSIPVKTENDIQDLNKVIVNKKEIYLFQYLTDITDPGNLFEKKLVNLHFKKVEIFNFNGVGFISLYKIQ